ncbi:MAG: BolA family protein [Myxococcota bacterium]
MSTALLIEQRLREQLAPLYLEVIDESHKHAGHAGARGGGGHFRVTLVSAAFEGKRLMEQHRLIYGLFREEMKQQIHALALQTLTPSEWEKAKG